MKNIKKVLGFFLLPISLYLIDLVLAKFTNFYFTYQWLDIPMHFLGGFLIGNSFILLFSFFEKKGLLEIKNKILFIFVIVSIVSFIAVLWEFYEFLLTLLGIIELQTLTDTLSDLSLGILGGFCISFLRG